MFKDKDTGTEKEQLYRFAVNI